MRLLETLQTSPSSLCKPSLRAYFDWDDRWNNDYANRPVLLDTFCGGGGAAFGYFLAGFRIVGVDIAPQKRYPFEFVQADALEYLREHGREYDAIHSSPPCQAYSISARGTGKVYPDLLAATRDALILIGKPWMIENVPNAPMRADFALCGCMFGLELRRLRYFETNWHTFEMVPPCVHYGPVLSVVGHGTPTWVRNRWQKEFGRNPKTEDYQKAMGISWMNRDELSQAIPPAYTFWVGIRLMESMK